MTNDLEEKLATLRQEYKSNLSNKMNELNQAWKDVLKTKNPDKINAFRQAIHKLHGSAGTYGYTELSKIAGNLEILLNQLVEFPEKLNDNAKDISSLLSELEKMVERTMKETEVNALTGTESQDKKQDLIISLLDSDKSYENNLPTQLKKFGYQVIKLTGVDSFLEQFDKTENGIFLINMDNVNAKLEKKMADDYQANNSAQKLIIFFAPTGEFTQRLRAVRMGGKAFFVKPFQTEDLITAIDYLLKSDTESYHILIVDDDKEVAYYNAAILEKSNMKTTVITQSTEIDRALHQSNPDLILIDINMPECSGLELASIIRQQSTFESTPIIYLSTEADDAKKLNAMKLGADDFITKSTSATSLVTTVKNRIKRYKKLQALLVKDNLTGLYNHSFLLRQLEIELKESMLLHNPLTIALVDLDKFKTINDTYGHQIGDQILKGLGLMLQKRLRPNDIIGRYAAAKFLVILPNTSSDAAKSILEELHKHFLTVNYSYNQQIFNASFSTAIASFPEFHTVHDLIEAVDKSIAMSKKSGPNRIQIATHDII